MRILVVEDDEHIAKTLENVLGNQHYVVDVATDGMNGWELVEAFSYDLILLDVILPKLDGIKLCQKLRSCNYHMPVLLLTAQNSNSDKVMGLDAGADDYVVKPFELSELLARIRVLLRRKNSPILSVMGWENLRLDPGNCEVTYNGNILNLTPKEYRLLELFLRNEHLVFSRSDILDHLWSVEEAPKEDTVTAHIKGLRQKLTQAGAPTDFIETVYGLGYRLKVRTSLHQTKENKKKQQTKEALTVVWERLKLKTSDRLAILEQACIALKENNLSNNLRNSAFQAAHKMSGSLGIFGFHEGSRLAQQIEQIFQPKISLNQNQWLHLGNLIETLKRELQEPAFKQFDKVVLGFVVDDAVD